MSKMTHERVPENPGDELDYPWVDALEVTGFRGFAGTTTLRLAVPNGTAGSGLTVIIGPNNSGKSSLVEAFKALGAPDSPELTRTMRNNGSDEVAVRARLSDGRYHGFRSIGGYATEWTGNGADAFPTGRIYPVPPRRRFKSEFGGGANHRNQQARQGSELRASRDWASEISSRIVYLARNRDVKAEFDRALEHLLGHEFPWEVDRADSGNFFISVAGQGGPHSTDGLGFGVLSLFYVVDAFLDAKPQSIILIDEPELSLHPSVQKRLSRYLAQQASVHQIVLATHSPLLLPSDWIVGDAEVIRVGVGTSGSEVHQPERSTREALSHLLRNINFPHTLGTEAREVLFSGDGVLLVEGQDDALLFPRLAKQVDRTLDLEVFGWGAGGADNMEAICRLLKELGFARVAVVLDGNRSGVALRLKEIFPGYRFSVLPADDIRDKRAAESRREVSGLADSKGTIHPHHVSSFAALIDEIQAGW